MLRISLIFMLCMLWVGASQAQIHEKTLRTWYKKMRRTKPMQYKALVEEVDSLRLLRQHYAQNIQQLRRQIAQQERHILELRASNQEAEREILEFYAQFPHYASTRQGLYMRVRFQPLQKAAISEPLLAHSLLEPDPTQAQYFLIGFFRNYWMADSFRRHLLKNGIKQTEVVVFCDQSPIDAKDIMAIILGGENVDCKQLKQKHKN